MKKDFAKHVWSTLSAINVNDHTDKKGRFTYLSWTWAWATLMEHYPESNYEFLETKEFNGSLEIWVSVSVIEGDNKITRSMFLPVMDFKNNAVISPKSRDVSDTRMRCLVKCLGMFGLGHYIYAGESIPSQHLEDTISGEPVDMVKVGKATKYFKDQINADQEEHITAEHLSVGYNKLTPDEQIAVNENLKKIKFENRQMNTILKDFLNYNGGQ